MKKMKMLAMAAIAVFCVFASGACTAEPEAYDRRISEKIKSVCQTMLPEVKKAFNYGHFPATVTGGVELELWNGKNCSFDLTGRSLQDVQFLVGDIISLCKVSTVTKSKGTVTVSGLTRVYRYDFNFE